MNIFSLLRKMENLSFTTVPKQPMSVNSIFFVMSKALASLAVGLVLILVFSASSKADSALTVKIVPEKDLQTNTQTGSGTFTSGEDSKAITYVKWLYGHIGIINVETADQREIPNFQINGATSIAWSQNGEMITNLTERGKQLRDAIDKKYKDLGGASAIKGPGQSLANENNITNIFLPYIKIGMSFDDAETILKSAGFQVSPHNQQNAIHGDNNLYAFIDPYKELPFGKITVGVSLTPPDPHTFSIIKNIEASFVKSTL